MTTPSASPEFVKFETLKDSGSSAREVAVVAIEDGFDFRQGLFMLRSVFGLDLVNAKEAWIQANGFADSPSEYQEMLIPDIEAVLNDLNSKADEADSV